MTDLDLPGTIRRVRRTADMSQRELARACGVAPTVVAKAETGERDLPVRLLVRLAAVAGFRLAVLDGTGSVVAPMQQDAVRDAAGRLFPAHLDTRHGDEEWWGGPHRPRLRNPRYTFDRERRWRDARRRIDGTPEDHHEPAPGDSLEERAALRRDQCLRAQALERRRRFLSGDLPPSPPEPPCTCPAGCEYAEGTNEDMAHTDACVCRCDVS